MKPRGKRAGTERERQFVARLRAAGWIAFRSPASLGCADVIAMRRGHANRLYEIKSTSADSPYAGFPPKDRRELLDAAHVAGANAYLVHWPPRQEPRVIPSGEWPLAVER